MVAVPSVDRVLAAYEHSDWIDRWQGAHWYEDTRAVAAAMHPNVEVAAGVIAALSPRETWTRNVNQARRLLSSGEVVGMGTSVAKAKRIVAGEYPLDVLRGNKTRAFYECIVTGGRTDAVCVDMHAWNLAAGVLTDGSELSRSGLYEATAEVYREAAAQLREQPCAVQATTWLWQRRVIHGKRVARPRTPAHETKLPRLTYAEWQLETLW